MASPLIRRGVGLGGRTAFALPAPGLGRGYQQQLTRNHRPHDQPPPGRENGYHTPSRRQYVITLSGHAELVLSGGQTIEVGPGSIELAEDLTGKGHITRTVGTEDRVVILIPVAAQ